MRVNKDNTQILDSDNGYFGRVDSLPNVRHPAVKVSLRLAIEKRRQMLQSYIDNLGKIPTSA